jgi:hypothetical protein
METKLNGGVNAMPRAAVAFLSRCSGLAFVIASHFAMVFSSVLRFSAKPSFVAPRSSRMQLVRF